MVESNGVSNLVNLVGNIQDKFRKIEKRQERFKYVLYKAHKDFGIEVFKQSLAQYFHKDIKITYETPNL